MTTSYQEAIANEIAYLCDIEKLCREGEAFEWPVQYVNAETGKPYKPHHQDEEDFVYQDFPRYALAKGGEGGGKSVAGIIKDLNRLRRGMNGIMVSPDFEHLKKSLWPEFRRWCPVGAVVERERYRLDPTWEPMKPFALHFNSEIGITSTLYCGGIEDPTGWEGPNVSFAHFDEARRHKDASAIKVLDGRVRIDGSNGETPQLYLTTTPAMHWLFDYFGPVVEDDQYLSFKRDSRVIKLLTSDNEKAGNLTSGYTQKRGQSLTEAEKRVLLEAEWEDIETTSHFLPSIIWWDGCREELGALDKYTPLVCAADGAYAANGDVFGFVAVSKHPTRENCVAVRYVQAWEAAKDSKRDFDDIEKDIEQFCSSFNVLELVYDPYQLHQMMSGLKKRNVANTVEFGQGKDRLVADKALLDLIMNRKLAHDGNEILRKHIDNADKKKTEDKKLRIVKRNERLKIDLAVCLSMAAASEALTGGWSEWA
jgi:hypothetical protein